MDRPYRLTASRLFRCLVLALAAMLLLAACQAPGSDSTEAGPAATLTAWRLPTDTPLAHTSTPVQAAAGATALLPAAAISGDIAAAHQPQQIPVEPPGRSAAASATPPPSPAAPPGWNPAMASDLLFRTDSLLVRWDPFTQSADLLADNVAAFTPSPTGRTVILLRPANIAANGVERFDLLLLDLQSGQSLPLLAQTPRLYHLAVSPDGQRLAYLEQADGGDVYTLRLPSPGQPASAEPLRLGVCQPGPRPGCTPPAWSPDSLSLLWLDERGAWLSILRPDDARLVQSLEVTVNDPRGGTSQMAARFSAPTWSPAGRFALVTVAPLGSQVSWQAVLDTRGERLVKIPGSYRQSELENNAAWMQNGDLLLAHAGGPPAHSIPYIQHYRLFATRQELFDLQRTFDLFTPPAETATLLSPTWLHQPEPESVVFLLQATAPDVFPELYRLNLANGQLERLGGLPFPVTRLSWSPDGQAALVAGVEGQALYFPFGGATLDLSPYLAGKSPLPGGEPTLEFSWLPPRPRPRQTSIP